MVLTLEGGEGAALRVGVVDWVGFVGNGRRWFEELGGASSRSMCSGTEDCFRQWREFNSYYYFTRP
jgi:hypothetical protein